MTPPMPRRQFLTASLATAATLTTASAMAAPTEPKRQFYELLLYQMQSKEMIEKADLYLKDALIPALRRAGTGPVGVFLDSPKTDAPSVYILIPHESLDAVLTTRTALQSDAEYQKAGAPFLAAPPKDPAYTNHESRLMLAAAFMPALEAPEKSDTRVFELRRYRNPSEAAFQKKLEMFATSELALFRRVGLNPVFFGETLFGPDMYNITYMLTFPDPAAKGKAWGTFIADDEWKKLSKTPGYTDPEIIANIKSIMLKPTAYSQI